MSTYDRLSARYESGDLPWDDELPPPEVMEFVSTLPPGRALDLGCGTGRASIYLARLGWSVDGVDFIPKAIEMAQARARRAGVSPRFHCAAVTRLDFLSGPYDLALDVGCLHALDDENLRAYHAELKRLLRPGGAYLLFVRLKEAGASPPSDDDSPEDGPRGIDEAILSALFQDGFVLDKIAYGATQVGESPPWRSAWFWFRRAAKVEAEGD